MCKSVEIVYNDELLCLRVMYNHLLTKYLTQLTPVDESRIRAFVAKHCTPATKKDKPNLKLLVQETRDNVG
jgi:hypothetical protein